MQEAEIMALMDSGEPLAIVRYFQWASFSRSQTQTNYVVLRLDHANRDIDEIDLPRESVPMVLDRMEGFDLLLRNPDGTVWERGNFAAKAKRLVPRAKLTLLISK